MKTIKSAIYGSILLIGLMPLQSPGGVIFSPGDLNNNAIAASPRAHEEYPTAFWLKGRSRYLSEKVNTDWTRLKANQALLSSPRIRELYPQIAYPIGVNINAVPPEIMGNTALSNSPRILEEFPRLARMGKRAPASTLQNMTKTCRNCSRVPGK